jgi:uncharacterized repeat protein (TIGR01451 family)
VVASSAASPFRTLRARRAAAWAAAALLSWLAGGARAQDRCTWTGEAPVKSAGGPGVTWNGWTYQVAPGGEILWTITIPHGDPTQPYAAIAIEDVVPAAGQGYPVAPFSFPGDVIAAPPIGTLGWDGNELRLDDGELELGDVQQLVLRTRVNANAPLGSYICNLAIVGYVGGPAPGPGPGRIQFCFTNNSIGDENVECVEVATAPSLAESWKTVADANGDGFASPGEPLTFTITVRNTGGSRATNVVVSDTLPAGLTPLAAGSGGVISGGTVTWTPATTPALASVSLGGAVTLTFTAVAQCLTEGGVLCNQATVSADETPAPVPTDDPADPALSAPTCLATRAPDLRSSPLQVTDASGDGRFDVGEAMTWALTVTNAGTEPATGVVAILPLPAEVTGIVPQDGGTVAGSAVTWTPAGTPALASIAAGGTVVLRAGGTLDLAAPDGASPCASATMDAGCGAALSDDPVPRGVADATCFTVNARPTVTLEHQALDPGADGVLETTEVVDYVLTVRGTSGAPAQDVAVELLLPGGGALGSLAADSGLVLPDRLRWTSATEPALAAVASGATVILRGRGTLTCAAADGAAACATSTLTATNLAGTVAGDDAALPGVSDAACVTTASADTTGATLLAIDENGDGTNEPGELVDFTLLVANGGTAPARDVVIELPLVAADLDVTATSGGVVSATSIRWSASRTPSLTILDPGEAVVLRATLRVDPLSNGQRTCHQATITWRERTGCAPQISDDPQIAGVLQPTCWTVAGDSSPPAEVPDGDPLDAGPVPVRLGCSGDDLVFTWDVAARALTYEIYRGPVASFRTRPWNNPASAINDPENAQPSCGLAALTYRDELGCRPDGTSSYYLVAGRNLIGLGSLGESLSGAVLAERPPVTIPCP